MKHLLTLGILLLLLCTTSLLSQETWLKVIGGSDGESGYSITRTLDDGILITGSTSSNDGDFVGTNKGNSEIFVIKLDKNGKILWNRILGGNGVEGGYSITTTSDDRILITGSTSSKDGDFKGMDKGVYGDIFVIKLDKDGSILWKKTFGGFLSDVGYSITTMWDGGILIAGLTFSYDGDFEGMSKGGRDIFVIKLDINGEVLWKKTFGGGGDEEESGQSITTTSDGGVLITGLTYSYDGDFEGMRKGRYDIFVIKLDTNGDVLWKRMFGGIGSDYGYSMTTTSDGGILIIGSTNSNDGDFTGMNKGYDDIFVIKLDKDGELDWKRTYGGSENEWGNSLTTTSDGGILITGLTFSYDGDFNGMNKGGRDIFVIKLDKTGEVVWKKTFGGEYFESGQSITTTSDDGILITGSTSSKDGDFKGLNKGGEDIFVVKLDSNGNYTPSTSVDEQTSTSTPLLVTPNPLSTSSTITYTIDTPSLVRIELMNTLGQVVDVVFDGYRDSGTHDLPLNVSTLTSGMYTVRMTSDNGVYTTQVCVVR